MQKMTPGETTSSCQIELPKQGKPMTNYEVGVPESLIKPEIDLRDVAVEPWNILLYIFLRDLSK